MQPTLDPELMYQSCAGHMSVFNGRLGGAAAANGQTCSGNICQSPGNVQINDARPSVQFYPYGDITFLLGGLGGHGGVRGGLMG